MIVHGHSERAQKKYTAEMSEEGLSFWKQRPKRGHFLRLDGAGWIQSGRSATVREPEKAGRRHRVGSGNVSRGSLLKSNPAFRIRNHLNAVKVETGKLAGRRTDPAAR